MGNRLTADRVRTECGVKISEKLIPDSARASKDVASWCKKGQPMKPCRNMTPRAVCIHNTEDLANVSDDAEQYTRATWPNCNMGGVVVHYYVDELGAWQNLREEEQGWHAGDGAGPGNTQSVAIEIIMDGSTGANNVKAEDNGARLAAAILHRWGLGIQDLHSHYFYSLTSPKKNCPLYIRPHWSAFEAKVRGYLEALAGGASSESGDSSGSDTGGETSSGEYRAQAGAFTTQSAAAEYGTKVAAAGFEVTVEQVGSQYKLFCGGFADRGEANALVTQLKQAGFAAFVTTEKGKGVSGELAVGSKVRVRYGAKTYTGGSLASFVYATTYTVQQINGDRIVIGINGVTTAAVRRDDLLLV